MRPPNILEDALKLWLIFSSFLRLCELHNAQASSTFTPFFPLTWPVAVKGPYLNTWIGGLLPASTLAFWPTWDDQVTWTCVVIVDKNPYLITGPTMPPKASSASQTAIEFTATKTIISLTAGPVVVNVTFLSPITPSDLVRQSMPFAYFYVDISSADGFPHDVRIYSDVNPQWLYSYNLQLPTDPLPKINATGSLINSTDFVGLQMQLQESRPFVEVLDHAQDVVGVYAMKSDSSDIKYQIGPSSTVLALGSSATGLQNTVDAKYSSHALDDPFDAFAITVDLGSIQNTSKSVMWTIGMLRDPSINLTTASGANQLRSSYYWQNFSSIPDIISFVLNDFDEARASANNFDQMIRNVSLSNVAGYTDLLSLAARQIFGTLEITLSKSSDGAWNHSDIMIFSKDMGDISSIGNSGGTNVVDVLYAGFPAVLFLAPNFGQYLLRPILESQIDSNGTLIGQPYAPQNLGTLVVHSYYSYLIALRPQGTAFPNVTCNTSPHNLGIEESGNMLIMVLALFQKTGDLSIIQNYYPLLKSWADYLVNQTFESSFQTSSPSDGVSSLPQTNLVLKGIIGISAMSSISSAIDMRDDQTGYKAIAQQYIQTWLDKIVSQDRTHLLSLFTNESSSGLIYNMYADKLLGLGLIPSDLTGLQFEFYDSLVIASDTLLGVPLDSVNSTLSRLDWTMFSVASFLDGVQDDAFETLQIIQPTISMLRNYATSPRISVPVSIVYNLENGLPYAGTNRSVLVSTQC
ncbi:hypothetical protein SCHPADRAFT_938385 [Schizopora paradoxa]|uniref:DUF1793-domain-containing protein n=1 Tax=Schizopora paradoxa TaxID=27342 RepID=A0A0H2S1W8_9AGAM|nr:hypothetical protein SCHPADRAFT_938385 [Schizopora paradoxa]